MLKSSLRFKKIQTLRVNNSKILRTKNAKFSEHYFYLNTNMYGNFQICISVPLRLVKNVKLSKAFLKIGMAVHVTVRCVRVELN